MIVPISKNLSKSIKTAASKKTEIWRSSSIKILEKYVSDGFEFNLHNKNVKAADGVALVIHKKFFRVEVRNMHREPVIIGISAEELLSAANEIGVEL